MSNIKQNIDNQNDDSDTDYKVGTTIRKAIKDVGDTLPEKLSTPKNC